MKIPRRARRGIAPALLAMACLVAPAGAAPGDPCQSDNDCGDGNVCTTDRCDPVTGCGNPPVVCDDHNACTADGCDPASGCAPDSFAPDGAPCDDGNVCTLNDSCSGGGCPGATGRNALDVGGSHACSIRADGRLGCWGDDYYGQVSGPNASTETYTAISTGLWHSCALRSDGRLACWGADSYGQVSGPNASTDTYAAVSAGDLHTCALRVDGRLACWGEDRYRQVSGPNASTGPFSAVSAGGQYTCALRSDGRLACWGDNGDGKVTGPNSSTESFAAVSAGGAHTCALRFDGRLACWGDNIYDGRVSGPNGSTDRYTSVSAGATHTCALRVDGHITCWGMQYQCFGGGSSDGYFDTPYCESDDRVSGPNASTDVFTGVVAGGASTCALRSDGRLMCWGSQTTSCWLASDPDGATTQHWECSSDDRVSGPNGSTRFYGLAQMNCDDANPCTVDSCDAVQGCLHVTGNAGAVCRPLVGPCDLAAETCTGSDAACPADTVAPATLGCRPAAGPCDVPESCDGISPACPDDVLLPTATECRPSSGQCGDAAENCTGTSPLCPANRHDTPDGTACDDGDDCTVTDTCQRGSCVPRAAANAVSVFAGKTCALRVDGGLACWGYDGYGEVSSANSSPDDYLTVSAGGDRACGVRTDGRLVCWGSDGEGGSTMGTTPSGWTSGPNASTDGYTAVSAGGTYHTCALRMDWRIKCWGSDQVGSYGWSNQVSGPNASADLYTVVSAAAYQTCAVRVDGRLRCWGYDDYGQVSGPNAAAETYAAVSTGGSHTCAVRADGRLACWGFNAQGQVSGPNANAGSYVAVSTAPGDTCALRSDGRLSCWGDDNFGQVAGPNASTDRYTAVSAAGGHTCALRSDKRLVCWGRDDGGEVSGPNDATQMDALNRPDCNDDNVCTDDSCEPPIGCIHPANAAPCSDGSACTRLDICSGGACVGTDPVVCSALDQCHAAGVCDPGTGVCPDPPRPDGTVCTDDNLCTTGDACQGGVCTPTFNGLDEPNPRTNGYYKRLCQGPHSGDQLTDGDAACVARLTTTFAGIATVTQICDVIEPSRPNNDACDRSEDDLMVLALNICRARVCTDQSIDSQCGNNGNVGQSLAESDAILGGAARDFDSCARAKCLDEEINTGRALEMNTLTLTLEAGNVRLVWTPPALNDGAARPETYTVWRRPRGSLSPYSKIGETTDTRFLDTTSGVGDWEYEFTVVLH